MTTKEPDPECLLPSVFEFIREFPSSHLSEVVLLPYLFQRYFFIDFFSWAFVWGFYLCYYSGAVNPRLFHLSQEYLKQLDLAGSYLTLLQNMELIITVSRQHRTRTSRKNLFYKVKFIWTLDSLQFYWTLLYSSAALIQLTIRSVFWKLTILLKQKRLSITNIQRNSCVFLCVSAAVFAKFQWATV